jgi:SOS-response transcriptional repressor LexA
MSAETQRPALSLTRLERRAVEVIQAFESRGIGPTIAEIAEAMPTGKGGVQRLIDQLEVKGWIVRQRYTARSIRLLHRLTPTGAVANLMQALVKAKPCDDGYVYVSIPVVMVEQAAAACGIERV